MRYSTDVNFLYYTNFCVKFVLQTLLQPTHKLADILLQLVKSGQNHLKMGGIQAYELGVLLSDTTGIHISYETSEICSNLASILIDLIPISIF